MLPKIGRPATNALASIGINTLEELAKYERTTILDTHGVGPKAISILENALTEAGLSFKNEAASEFPFEMVGVVHFKDKDNGRHTKKPQRGVLSIRLAQSVGN